MVDETEDRQEVLTDETWDSLEIALREAPDKQRILAHAIAEVIDIALATDLTLQDGVSALAQNLYTLVASDNRADAGKVLMVHVEPFDCGCLCVSVGATDPLPGFADSCEEAS